jgi:hypothetical protein
MALTCFQIVLLESILRTLTVNSFFVPDEGRLQSGMKPRDKFGRTIYSRVYAEMTKIERAPDR